MDNRWRFEIYLVNVRASVAAVILFSFIFLFLSYSQPVFSQNHIHRFSHGLIWKVEKTGLKASYLVGTMHVSDSRVTQFSSTLKGLINSCDSLTLEAKFDAHSQQLMLRTMLLQNGKRLSDYITGQELKVVVESLTPASFNAQMVALLKPWAATLLLSMPKSSEGIAMDAILQERFISLKKPVHQLESPMEQINLFEQLSIADQVEMLRETIAEVDTIDTLLEETLRLYLSEDIAGLLQLNNEYVSASNSKVLTLFLRQLVENRNHTMFDRMQVRLKEGNAMIAVGALHLPGNEGLLFLLESAGYRLISILQGYN
ncbi:MAG: TraB/GumN family protein [Pseudomonadales bacterium]|nr:TraB/GumN family protein [Pseudomonadales bacterium]